MENMIVFSTAIMSILADFLASEPIFYLFGLVCLCMVVKVFQILFTTKL